MSVCLCISDEYNLTLVAYDAGHPQLSGTLYIRVSVIDANDNSPRFDKSSPGGYDVTLAVDAPVGTPVVSVTASDPDLGDNGLVRYRFPTRTQVHRGVQYRCTGGIRVY